MSLDFVEIQTKLVNKTIFIYPEFITKRSNDLMIRGREFYAFWNDETGLWDRDIYDLYFAVDKLLDEYAQQHLGNASVKYMSKFSNGIVSQFNKYCKDTSDNYHELDTRIIFGNTKVKKSDYVSHVLSYPLEEGPIEAYDEMMRTLYHKDERQKIEWSIGSVIAGDAKDIQKFVVFYGPSGTGKSTVLNIIEGMFDGYCASFRAKDLGNPNNQFALEPLISNPLIAIDEDGDLSRIEDNTRLNTIVSHEKMSVNVKYARAYGMKFNSLLMIGTNTPVKITDSKSGIVRRLIDISPSGKLVARNRYDSLMAKIPFEYPGIAHHCLSVYLELGKTYYDTYKPSVMIDETNDTYNFVREMYWEWKEAGEVSLAVAWKTYKDWCEDSGVQYPLMKRKFKAELKNYFNSFLEHTNRGDNIYIGLKSDMFKIYGEKKEERAKSWLNMKAGESILDDILSDCKAQYATEDEIPRAKWVNVKSTLKEIDTSQVHYVKVPENHIVIDFDLKNDKGEKDPLLNFEAASKFPQTYAELSKGGSGIHLHYIYEGDVNQLSRIYADDIEVKVFTGNSSLRRRLSKCNDIPPTTINSGLPLKGENKTMVDSKAIENDAHLKALIKTCLNKEHHGHTKPEVDFIAKILNDAYANESLSYDIRPMRPQILSFAMSSTNRSQECYDICSSLHYCSKDHENGDEKNAPGDSNWNNAPIVFFDCEVFPNLFIVCWKKLGEDQNVVRMINPTPAEIKQLFNFRLVGFYNRNYDNHILYARSMGYTNAELFRLSHRIVNKHREAYFGEAYGLSYTDIHDYATKKQSLKKWEIELGIFHLENSHPWDQDVPEEYWDEIADYCCNDVIATEAVWNATKSDFEVRQVIAKLSGLTVNDTNRKHIIRIILGDDRQINHVYTDLATGEVM